MFDKEYSFKGTHAEKVIKLTSDFDSKGNKLFSRNLDVYLLAPIVGFLYGVKAELDKNDINTKIFPDIMMKNKDDLLFNYRLIILLDKNHEKDLEKRINKAFRFYGSDNSKDDEILFESYVRGGVDKLYEKLIENSPNTDYYLRNLFNFIDEIEERYNSVISLESISDLCRLAKN